MTPERAAKLMAAKAALSADMQAWVDKLDLSGPEVTLVSDDNKTLLAKEPPVA